MAGYATHLDDRNSPLLSVLSFDAAAESVSIRTVLHKGNVARPDPS